jgi:hypothetical protein
LNGVEELLQTFMRAVRVKIGDKDVRKRRGERARSAAQTNRAKPAIDRRSGVGEQQD